MSLALKHREKIRYQGNNQINETWAQAKKMPQAGPSLILMKITEEGGETHSGLQDFVITGSLVFNL